MKAFIWFKNNMMRLLSGEQMPLVDALIAILTFGIIALVGLAIATVLLIPVVVTFPVWGLIYAYIKAGKEEEE